MAIFDTGIFDTGIFGGARFTSLSDTYSLGASMTNSRSEANRMTKTISAGFVDLVNTRGTNP